MTVLQSKRFLVLYSPSSSTSFFHSIINRLVSNEKRESLEKITEAEPDIPIKVIAPSFDRREAISEPVGQEDQTTVKPVPGPEIQRQEQRIQEKTHPDDKNSEIPVPAPVKETWPKQKYPEYDFNSLSETYFIDNGSKKNFFSCLKAHSHYCWLLYFLFVGVEDIDLFRGAVRFGRNQISPTVKFH
jgi:hypothetical protein